MCCLLASLDNFLLLQSAGQSIPRPLRLPLEPLGSSAEVPPGAGPLRAVQLQYSSVQYSTVQYLRAVGHGEADHGAGDGGGLLHRELGAHNKVRISNQNIWSVFWWCHISRNL